MGQAVVVGPEAVVLGSLAVVVLVGERVVAGKNPVIDRVDLQREGHRVDRPPASVDPRDAGASGFGQLIMIGFMGHWEEEGHGVALQEPPAWVTFLYNIDLLNPQHG